VKGDILPVFQGAGITRTLKVHDLERSRVAWTGSARWSRVGLIGSARGAGLRYSGCGRLEGS